MSFSLSHISRFVLWGSVGFIIGIGLESFFNLSTDIYLFIVVMIALSVIVIFYDKRWMWSFVFFILMGSWGFIIMSNVFANIAQIEKSAGTVLQGQAHMIKNAVEKEWNSQVLLQYEDNTTVLIKDEKYTKLKQGDIVQLRCKTSIPEQYDDFDYHKYLVMRGIEYICEDMEYEVVGHKDNILSRLSQLRLYMENIVNNAIPAPQSALANGLLFGGDDLLSEEMQTLFAKTGMTHIVAVSGYNVSIIVAVVMGLVIFVGVRRQYAVWFAILGVVFFVALIGFPSSGLRAAVMGSLVLVAAAHGRVVHAYGAIFFTGAIMLLLNPLLLRYDIGFQLSFLATLGIVAVYPILEKYFVTKNKAFGFIEVLLLTVSAQIFVLPIIIYHFHTLSTVSLLANVLVLPFIPLSMLFVFLLIVTSFIFYPLALFFGWIAYFILLYEIFIITMLSRIPYSSIVVDNINAWWFVIYYIIVGSLVYILNKKLI